MEEEEQEEEEIQIYSVIFKTVDMYTAVFTKKWNAMQQVRG